MPQAQRKMTAVTENKDDFAEVLEDLLKRNERANFSYLFKAKGRNPCNQ